MSLLVRIRLVRDLVQAFGPRWALFRAGYALQQRTGLLQRRQPPVPWEEVPLHAALSDPSLADPEHYFDYRRHAPATFFFEPGDRSAFAPILRSWDDQTDGPQTADAVLRGTFRYFTARTCDRGLPPDWHLNPFTQQRAPETPHWSRIGDYDHGDIKVLWELSRFSFSYDLVRAYWRTGDEAYAEAFWHLVEDWRLHNPPHRGANWKCGQETSFRVMAWCFGLYGFLGADASTPDRVVMLVQMLAVSGERIEHNLRYALSQRNNHGISEATGLWTIGLLFPELRRAARWRALGAKHLEELGRDLIYDDGAFVQHSTNYHRLMLHDYLWCLRLGEVNGQRFSDELYARLRRASHFLYEIQDDVTGQASFYGNNDGALILPLSNCTYHDVRPAVSAVHYLVTNVRQYQSGPWDEDLLWLFGLGSLAAPVTPEERSDLAAPIGGVYTLRSSSGFALMRCPSFVDRPAQSDALHTDIWFHGRNIALDAGTYSYNAPPPWHTALSDTGVHNTVQVDGLNQMERLGRYLWLPWLQSRVHVQKRSKGSELSYWEGEHNGYARLQFPATHRRGVAQLGPDHWLILDALTSSGSHDYTAHWLMTDAPFSYREEPAYVQLELPDGPYGVHLGMFGGEGTLSVQHGSEEGTGGWWAPHYGDREPAISIQYAARKNSALFWAIFGPLCTVKSGSSNLLVVEDGRFRADVSVCLEHESVLVQSITLDGSVHDELEISPCASC